LDAFGGDEVAYGEHVADGEVRDVRVDVLRNVRGQAGELELVGHEAQNALRVPHADGLADRMHGDAHGDRAVSRYFLKVDVQQIFRDRVELHVANDRHARAVGAAVELQGEQLRRAFVAVDHLQHGLRVDGDGLRGGATVEHGGDPALAAQALGGLLALAISG